MSAPTQVCVEFKIGFNGLAYTGYQCEDWTESEEAEVEAVKNDDNETATKIIYDAKTMTSGSFLIKSTGSVEAPAVGTLLSIQGPNDVAAVKRFVASSSVAFSRGVSKLTVSLEREAAM
ncbi:MAG TPA: hypothetical protein VJ904_01140, partial [Tichowtungia sp.]|nr:hypothetical protein [Tichowtungia sp.]